MKESRKFYREKIWKVLQLENVSKVLTWVNQVSIYRPRSNGHLASSKRSFVGFFNKKSGKKYNSTRVPTIFHDCVKWKVHQHHFFCLPRAFRMTVRNFRMVIRNQLSLLLFFSFDSTSTTFNLAPKLCPSALPLSHHPYCVPSSIPFLFCHSMLQKSP